MSGFWANEDARQIEAGNPTYTPRKRRGGPWALPGDGARQPCECSKCDELNRLRAELERLSRAKQLLAIDLMSEIAERDRALAAIARVWDLCARQLESALDVEEFADAILAELDRGAG